MTFEDAFRNLKSRWPLPDMPPLDLKLPIDRIRSQFFRTGQAIEPEAPELADIRALTVPRADGGLMKARLYVPLGAGMPPGPGIVFFHGGGFVLGDLESHEMICRRIAAASRCRLLAVDYRLAPEHRFPAAHDDALATWAFIHERVDRTGIDPRRVAVAGDSAGGNLAAFLCQHMIRAGGPRPAFQLLLYPLLQFADIRSMKLPAHQSGLFISASLFEFFRDNYLPDAGSRMDVRVSPLFAGEADLKGLPPAHIMVCGWDPLHDEGLAYAAKLEALGVKVSVREYGSMMHGFLNLTQISATAREAAAESGRVVGQALAAL